MSSVPTPGGGSAGCSLVLGAAVIAFGVVYLLVHLVVWAVTP